MLTGRRNPPKQTISLRRLSLRRLTALHNLQRIRAAVRETAAGDGEMQILDPELWNEKKKILVILAHPDDPEFFCGATIARWCAAGHEVHYCLLTKGQKGAPDLTLSETELAAKRVIEQQAAADSLGVKSVEYMDYIDGEVLPDLDMRKKIVRVIRKW